MNDQFSVSRSMASHAPRRIGGAARRCGGLAVATLAAVALAAAPGQAQPRLTGAAAQGKDQATEIASGPLLAVVSLSRQRISVYGSTGLVAQSPVSTGMAGYRTPAGVFSILQRSRFHRSNIYSNAPMPYMQRLTWSGVALHAGVLPGYPASHGCIRLPHQFAADLWGKTKIGTRVVVARGDASPVPIEDPRLPAASLTPAPLDEGRGPATAGHETPASTTHRLKVADASGDFEPSRMAVLDPLRRARARKAIAAAKATETVGAAKLAIKTSAAKVDAARHAAAALRTAELALLGARRRHDAATRGVARALTPVASERAVQSLATAEDDLAQAEAVADEAWLMEAVLRQEALEAETAAADAEDARLAAAAALKEAERALEPISIFVSWKTGRVYIRQAWVPVHEAPVAFTDATSPFGTHLYLALGPGADGETLRWLAASLPASAPRQSRLNKRAGEPAPVVSGSRGESATTALARFELSEETKQFISDRLWAGASLIVSDYGGSETGTYTDFIVLAR
ncbi:MAG TPA: L,D-transpeptidase family protein [Hyphomicrobiaceae bacterium]|jgi:hypothetical protein|nr:L,D-transpeptidase family protein [Hyphomicrobiaceae bacterium]